MCNYRYLEHPRSNLYIIIDFSTFAKIKLKTSKLFVRSLAGESLNSLLNKQNLFIRRICNYYSINRECIIQLNLLEPFFYKRM